MILTKGIVLLDRCLRVGPGTKVNPRLQKRLYSMKQSRHNWFETLDHFLSFNDLLKLKTEYRRYVLCRARTENQAWEAVLVWVNDMILFGSDNGDIKRSLQQHF